MSLHLHIPALSDANPGRPGWSIATEVTEQADRGSNSLAAAILRTGYDPAEPVIVGNNTAHTSLQELMTGILLGLDARKDKGGNPRPLILANDQEGRPIPVAVDRIRQAISDLDPHEAIPEVAVPAGGDGRRRTVGYTLAFLYASALGREIGPIVTSNVGSDNEMDALRRNLARSFGKALGPWQKVQAAVAVLKEKPTMSEADLQASAGCLRGDAQLMHRAGLATVKHKLQWDVTTRCPGKEEWKPILDAKDAKEAQELLDKAITSTRPKKVGIDKVAQALAMVPEGVKIDCRALAGALEAGTEEALSALLSPLL